MSLAKPLAVSYRRSRSLASAFITIQSSSPFTNRPSFAGSVCRLAATLGLLSVGTQPARSASAASCSRISRSISSRAAFLIVSRVERRRAGQQFVQDHAQGVDVGPRVDVHGVEGRLLRGHVQRRAQARCRTPVNSVCSVSCRPVVALARPKSITLGTGLPSWLSTRMFDGFRSRWMMPFWWACCTAEQICMNRSSRSGMLSLCASQILGERDALDQFHDEERRARVRVGAGVEQLGDVRMVHQRDGLALGLEAGQDRLRLPRSARISLTATRRLTGSVWSAIQTAAHAAFADLLQQLVLARR